MWAHNEQATVCNPRRGLSPDAKSASTSVLDFWASSTMGIKCLLFNSPNLQYFVIAAWAKAIGKSTLFFQNWLRKKKWLNTTQVYFLLTLLTQHWSPNNKGRMELCSMWTSKNPGWQNSLHLEMYHLKQVTSTVMIAKEEISGDWCTDA